MDEANAAPPSIFEEMQRQAEDARSSFAGNGEVAKGFARAARQSGRLVLLGMGASHAANRVVEPLYRAARIDTNATPVSEALAAPFPAETTVLLCSQSGESGEIVEWLDRESTREARFGLTLNPDSTLARGVPSFVGHGGVERAFAATRSLMVSLAMHACALQALGVPHDRAVDAATRREPLPVKAAAEAMQSVDAVVFSGRGALAGVAEAAALGMLELARLPAFALEGGQLRHGPVEALGPRLGVVLVRGAQDPKSSAALARICVEGGSPTLVFDLSGSPPVDGALTLAFTACDGLEAALSVLPTLQRFLIAVAEGRVENVGVPVRSSKVTRDI